MKVRKKNAKDKDLYLFKITAKKNKYELMQPIIILVEPAVIKILNSINLLNYQ